MNILLVGAPGVGKGTVSEFLEKNYDLPSISTGHIGRQEIKNQTEIGKELEDVLANGKFFSDDLALSIAKVELERTYSGVILDGFPRNMTQVVVFDHYFQETNRKLHLVLNIVNDDENIIARLKDRRTCPSCNATYHLVNKPPHTEGTCDACQTSLVQRDDDRPEVVKERLDLYREVTLPLLSHYEKQGIVRTVSSDCSIQEMYQSVVDSINSL